MQLARDYLIKKFEETAQVSERLAQGECFDGSGFYLTKRDIRMLEISKNESIARERYFFDR